jgi:hypothetical protein
MLRFLRFSAADEKTEGSGLNGNKHKHEKWGGMHPVAL